MTPYFQVFGSLNTKRVPKGYHFQNLKVASLGDLKAVRSRRPSTRVEP